jgi:protein-S-isoprenylcysteine O-methyltransferase Ste14
MGAPARPWSVSVPDPDALPDVPQARSAAFLFHGQLIHLGSLPFLTAIAAAFAAPALGDGAWLGITDSAWFTACLVIPVVHQVFVWLGWRAQLGWHVFTRIAGRFDFRVWGALFLPLLAARPLGLLGLAIADAGSANLPPALGMALGPIALAVAAWAMSSVVRHFGFDRALGGDHFRERYRHMPLVREGAFRHVPNAMYLLVFLGLWGIALVSGSLAALAAAFFQHAFIWAHYLGTEEPDMRALYRQPG